MFATILGALPRPPLAAGVTEASDAEALAQVVAAQEAAGIDLVGDGGAASPAAADALERWRRAAGLTGLPVKATLVGPYTAGWRVAHETRVRQSSTIALAEDLRRELEALAAAGCPLVEIDEPEAVRIGGDKAERRLFHDAHRRLTDGLEDMHLCLVLSGGNVDTAGAATLLDANYASYALDLINGPDNWRLANAVPGDRGIVCAAMDPRPGANNSVEILVWAVHYAASTGGRGLARVGLANAPGLDRLDWDGCTRLLGRLGTAARIAQLRGDELAAAMDPRTIDIRSAALGRHAPRRPR